MFLTLELVVGYWPPCRADDLRAISGWIGENWSGTIAIFVPSNSEIWAGGKRDTGPDYLGSMPDSMVGFYGITARQPAQKLKLVLGISSDGHFDACGKFWGAPRENWSGTVATFGLGQNLPMQASSRTGTYGSDFDDFSKIRIC